MQDLIFSLTIIITGLVIGYIGQKIAKKMRSDHENSILFIRKLLQKIGLLFLMPVSFVAAVWIVSFEDIRITLLPLIGAFALLLGGALGLIMASFTKNGEKQRGEFFCCGSFTNLGSLGALITFVFLG
jgi:predicted permease